MVMVVVTRSPLTMLYLGFLVLCAGTVCVVSSRAVFVQCFILYNLANAVVLIVLCRAHLLSRTDFRRQRRRS